MLKLFEWYLGSDDDGGGDGGANAYCCFLITDLAI